VGREKATGVEPKPNHSPFAAQIPLFHRGDYRRGDPDRRDFGAKCWRQYVSTSHFVWTAQIAVTLVALAIGYYFGGWLVGRSTKLGRLYVCILLAAIYLCVSVLVREPIAYACLEFRLALGALLTSALLFFVPLTLLATTGPFLIRVLTQSVNSVGEQVGRLFAISTLGSVAGTVLIGYLLIPFFPNSVTMFVTSALLMLVAAGIFCLGTEGATASLRRDRHAHWDLDWLGWHQNRQPAKRIRNPGALSRQFQLRAIAGF
jgi:MFS family permease